MQYRPEVLSSIASSTSTVGVPIILRGLSYAPVEMQYLTPVQAMDIASALTVAAARAIRWSEARLLQANNATPTPPEQITMWVDESSLLPEMQVELIDKVMAAAKANNMIVHLERTHPA